MLPSLKSGIFTALIFFMLASANASEPFRCEADMAVLIGEQKDSLIISDLAEFAHEAQKINERFFSHRLKKKVRIYLTASAAEYQKFSPVTIPDWSSGIAFISQHIIVLKPGSYYDPAQYRQTLLHEISHIYMGELIKIKRLPVWLNEGTANYLSGKSVSWEESVAIGNALAANKLVDLNAIDSLLTFVSAKASLAYLEAFLAVQYIVEMHGEDKLGAIIHSLAAGSSLDEAFTENLGYDFIDFEIQWFDDLRKRYRWIAFMQFENLFLGILILTIFLAFILRYYRNKKIYKRWEEEEQQISV